MFTATTPLSRPPLREEFTLDHCLIGAWASHPNTGKRMYAQAIFDLYKDKLNLDFSVATKPFSEMETHFRVAPPSFFFDKKAPLDAVCPSYARYLPVREEDLDKTLSDEKIFFEQILRTQYPEVKIVQINLSFQDAFQSGSDDEKLSSGLVKIIGLACRILCPAMDPRKSNFNLHFGFSSFHIDSQLLPLSDLSRGVSTMPK